MEPNPIGPTMSGWLNTRAQLGELAPATVDTYLTHMASFVAHVGPDTPVATVTAAHLERWLASLDVAPSTRNTRMATVRSFFAWAHARELVPRDPCRLVRRAKVPRAPAKRARPGDLATVLAHVGGRDRTLLLLALQCFLRRGELAALQVSDWDPAARELYVRGKGGHHRTVPVPAEAARALNAWSEVLGRRSGPMWPSSHRPGAGLSPRTISHLVRSAGEACDVVLWTHLLRHTGLSDAAEVAGADYVALAQVAGHADPSTTMRVYAHPRDHQRRAVVEGRQYRGDAVA